MLTIFIDESGTLPDPEDKFIVICGVGVRKMKDRKIADTPENFALLVADLVNEINLWYNKIEKVYLVMDRHFQRKVDQDKFNKFLKMKISKGLKYQIKHIDSQQNFLVNIADMAAGAILWKYSDKDVQFYNLIKENIVVEKIVNWPEIKRKV